MSEELRTTRPEAVDGNRWWLSWYLGYGDSAFELWSPWWVSGYTDDETIFVAAIVAETEEEAKQIVMDSFDTDPLMFTWRFVESVDRDWAPFGSRFPRADWMVWPDEG